MDVLAMQAAARAKLAGHATSQISLATQVLPDSTFQEPEDIVLRAHQVQFTIVVNGRRIMFNNSRFTTKDPLLAATIVGEYAPRIWRE